MKEKTVLNELLEWINSEGVSDGMYWTLGADDVSEKIQELISKEKEQLAHAYEKADEDATTEANCEYSARTFKNFEDYYTKTYLDEEIKS